ncbi:hypothetical protein BHE74_00019297 [Ensete ventricosum]|nr:hypothetical protein BHE74_00019297 [Ensete ventricosum]
MKEGDRYVVNHGEGLTVVDFDDHVSLAEKEGASMAERRFDTGHAQQKEWSISCRWTIEKRTDRVGMDCRGRRGNKGWPQEKRGRANLARKINGREEAGNNAVGRGRGPRLLRLPGLQGQMRATGCGNGTTNVTADRERSGADGGSD